MDIYFFQNLMALMFKIWEIWDEEPRSIEYLVRRIHVCIVPIIIDSYMNSVSPLPPMSIASIWAVSACDDSDVIRRFSFFFIFISFLRFILVMLFSFLCISNPSKLCLAVFEAHGSSY